ARGARRGEPHRTRPQGSGGRDVLSRGARSGPATRQPAGRDRPALGRRGTTDEPMRPLPSHTITAGVERTPNRAMLRAVGFGDQDFTKPIIGIANAHSTITPCNAKLNDLALRAEAAVRAAGGMPQTFGTITVSDGISMGTEGMKYSLVSREVIADSIETVCNAQCVDGVVAVGGCDKNMPGALIAIARMNIPA